jgi:hypothetical protein
MSLPLIEALAKLDPKNDNHWTVDGEPRLDTVKFFAGTPTLMREDLNKVSVYTRKEALAGTAPVPAGTPAAAEAPPAAVAEGGAAAGAAPLVLPVAASAAPAAAEPPAAPVPEKPFNLEESKAELEEIEKDLTEIRVHLAKVQSEKDKREEKASALRALISKHSPGDTNSNAIREYLESRKRALLVRAGQLQRVQNVEQELGVKLKDLVPQKAPIDQVRQNAKRKQ